MPAVEVLPLPLAKLRIASPSATVTPNTGTVVPGTVGEIAAATLLEITTAVAPAATALLTLMTKLQVPRRISAVLPVKVPAGYATQPSSTVLKPALTLSGVVLGSAAV